VGRRNIDERQNFFDYFNNPNMNVRELNFLTGPSEILQALLKSKDEGIAIGIKATCLGGDTVITGVEDIHFGDGRTLIILKQYDHTGYILPVHKINLLEIQAVCPFTTSFINPFLNNIDKDKSWFF
jgi:hypothetical protein